MKESSGDIALLARLVASVPAFPVAYLIINKWLSGFAYRTNVGVGPFLLSGFIALIVALASIIIQTVKAATADPIKSIRYE